MRPRPSSIAIAVAGLLSLAVAMGIGRFAFTPVLPLMVSERQIDVAGGGWVAAANYAGYLVGAMTASRLRWDAMRLCAVALAGTVLLTAAMALEMPVAAWAALRLAAGVASAWAFVGTAVWCLGALAQAGRASLAPLVYAGVGTGIALAGVLCVVAPAMGAHAAQAWIALALLAVLLLLPVAWTARGLHVEATAVAQVATAPAQVDGETRLLVLCYGALGFGYILPATFLPVMARSLVDDPRVFGLAWPLFGVTAAASTFVAGWALRRASRLTVWAACHGLMAAGVLLPSVWLSGTTIALSALLVGGTFMIVTMVGVQEMRARASGPQVTSLVARTTAAFAIGQIAGPIASSLLLHVPGFAQHGLALALQVACAALAASSLVVWRVARRASPSQEVPHVR